MPPLAATHVIRAPRSRIWSAWLDIDRWPEWTPTITKVRRLDTGPLHVGTTVGLCQPKLRPALWKVTELNESAGLFIWQSRTAGVTATGFHRAEAVAEGTRVTLAIEFEGLLAPLVRLFYGRLTRQYIGIELAGLKDRCES